MTEAKVNGKGKPNVEQAIEQIMDGVAAEIEQRPSLQESPPLAPGAERLSSGAMIHTAEAHDQVLARLDAIDAISKAIRETVMKNRRETDRRNREFIDLCSVLGERAQGLHEALTKVGSSLVEQARQ